VGGDNGQESDNEPNSDTGQDKINDKSNVATVGEDYQNKVDEYFAKLQAKYPNDKLPFMTYGQKLSVCLGQKHVPMLDKFDEHLERFHNENVLHANDQIVCEYMLNPVSQKPNEVKRWIQDSKEL